MALENRAEVVGGAMARRRIVGGILVLGCAAVLGLAAWMTPSTSGLGTHEQLNLPACGWINVMDMPCMTCGMTTAFSHAVRGELLQSFLTQPLGCVLAIVTAMTLVISLHVAVTGSNIVAMLVPLWRPSTMWGVAAFGLGAWLYKVLAYKGVL